MANPVKSLELHYPVIQFLIMLNLGCAELRANYVFFSSFSFFFFFEHTHTKLVNQQQKGLRKLQKKIILKPLLSRPDTVSFFNETEILIILVRKNAMKIVL